MTTRLTTALLALSAFVPALAGQPTLRTVASLHRYNQPAGLIEGSPGVFYSITAADIFSVTSQGTLTVLATFPIGDNISSLPVSGPDNRFYSAFQYSTASAQIFSVDSSPNSRVLDPAQKFALALSQNLPGGAFLGIGAWDAVNYVITANTNGTVTPIYQFPASDKLLSNVAYASDGNYYGVAQQNPAGTGYVYRVTPSGSLTKLYAFPANTFAGFFNVAILQAGDGNLYGTTPTGGPQQTGTIYKLTPGGQYTLLYTFPNDNNGGPTTLIEASDGNLYGATLGAITSGGRSQLFRITKSGHFTQLFVVGGAACYCSLVQGSGGVIYGTAVAGGSSGSGEIFAMNVGLAKPKPWPRQFSPQSGPAGAQVLIWGSNLLAAAVSFNGVPAANVYSSGSNYVWATVPPGAASGPITVTTPGGTNTTQASFTVQ